MLLKVKFSEETKKKFRTWLKRKDNCGRIQFCKELKQFDLDGYFTVVGNNFDDDPKRVVLKEMPDWYFHVNEFAKEE